MKLERDALSLWILSRERRYSLATERRESGRYNISSLDLIRPLIFNLRRRGLTLIYIYVLHVITPGFVSTSVFTAARGRVHYLSRACIKRVNYYTHDVPARTRVRCRRYEVLRAAYCTRPLCLYLALTCLNNFASSSDSNLHSSIHDE